ncbi:HPP family-domain-containing protein [Dissophora ornata]|nr:hypothetical protein BGZ58_006278 [Dissophora ornata]KAI8606093.1 HPP family-domain-containing protein [Dissophora ornata]
MSKMKGERYDPSRLKKTPRPPTRFIVLLSSFLGSFIGIAIVSSLTYNVKWFVERNAPVIAGSFGASAVLMYGAIESPLSQPRNVIGGHIMSSLIGVSLFKLFDLLSEEMFVKLHWLLCALSVSLSLMCMQVTHTVHPPASATALIAVTGGPVIYDLGYWYVLCPVALGVAIMMVVALLVNNVARKYPTHWWSPKTRTLAIVDQDLSTAIADFVMPDDDDNEEETRTASANSANQGVLSSSASTVNELPVPSQPHPRPHNHPEGQYAIYYGGDHNEALRDGQKMVSSQSQGNSDPEHGHRSKRQSIQIEVRGVPHHAHSSYSGSPTTEAEYRATIEQLQQRIQELENQLAST